jgi:hypothetical protein
MPRTLPPEPPPSGSARWISSCPPLGTAARFAAPTPSAAFPTGMANGDRLAPPAPSSVPPRGADISAPGATAARDPPPRGGRDRRYKDRGGPGGFGSMAMRRRFVRDGDLTAEQHGRRGRRRPRFALAATPGSPASRPPLPAPHWPRSAPPGSAPSGEAPRRGSRGSRRFVSAGGRAPGRRGVASAMAGLDSRGRSGTGEPRTGDAIRQNI